MIEHHRRVIAWLESVGALGSRIETGGKHCRLVFVWQGREIASAIAATPSDRRATDRQISDLRHQLGLIRGEKKVGARRIARARAVRPVMVGYRPLGIAFADDLRAQLERHPAGAASLRYRLDRAWLAWWRDLMKSVGGRSLI